MVVFWWGTGLAGSIIPEWAPKMKKHTIKTATKKRPIVQKGVVEPTAPISATWAFEETFEAQSAVNPNIPTGGTDDKWETDLRVTKIWEVLSDDEKRSLIDQARGRIRDEKGLSFSERNKRFKELQADIQSGEFFWGETQLEMQRADAERQRQEIEKESKKAITAAEDLFAQQLAQRTEQIQARGKRVMETTQRLNSLRWAGRSSKNEADIQKQQWEINAMIAAAEADSNLRLRKRKMEIEWATAEAMSSINKSIAANEKVLNERIDASLKKQAALNEAIDADFQSSIQNSADIIESADPEAAAKIDIQATQTANAWYFLDSNGDVVLNAKWEPIIYKAPKHVQDVASNPLYQFVQAKIDNVTGQVAFPAGYFNKQTWEFKPINFGGEATQVEFQQTPWAPMNQTQIAEYSQVYKWSSANPNGIDLAGKKWSAINTPVSGTVVFVWENGGWGNQVKIRDAEWQIHQFSHLDGSNLQEGQFLTRGSMVWTMGNTWNVLKWDWTKPTAEELAAGRWTHLDYTVLDAKGNKLPLSVAMSYAGLSNTSWETSPTTDAIQKWYDTATKIKLYNKILSEWGTPPDLKTMEGLNVEQSKSLGFAQRMGNDIDIIKELSQEIKDLSTFQLAWYRRIFGTEFWNQFVPPKVQQFLQAERDFIQAQLRKESGAAIPADEIQSFIKTIGIIPWDSEAVINQKLELMETMLEAMITSAWPWSKFIRQQGQVQAGWMLDAEDEAFFWTETTIQPAPSQLDDEDQAFFDSL